MIPIRSRTPAPGFSLIEMIIVIVILGVIGALGSTMLNTGFNAYFIGQEMTEIDWQGRLAVERVSRDLRRARTATAADLTINPATQISFVDIDGQAISYQLSGVTLMRNTRPLADNVSALNFSYLQNDGKTLAVVATEVHYIIAEITVSSGASSRVLRTTIHPRRF